MIQVQVFSNTESAPSEHPRGGHAGDVFELVLLSLRYDAERFDVLAFARNKRSGERWSRHFTQEPDHRQVSRAVDWLLELVGGERSAEVLRAVAPPLEYVGACTHPPGCNFCAWCGFRVSPTRWERLDSLADQIRRALAASANEAQ